MNSGTDSQAIKLRKIRYRINRLGMLELEAWLGKLEPALLAGDEVVADEVLQLLELEAPLLIAIMHGEQPVPEALQAWL